MTYSRGSSLFTCFASSAVLATGLNSSLEETRSYVGSALSQEVLTTAVSLSDTD